MTPLGVGTCVLHVKSPGNADGVPGRDTEGRASMHGQRNTISGDDRVAMRQRATDGADHEWGWYVDDVPQLLDRLERLEDALARIANTYGVLGERDPLEAVREYARSVLHPDDATPAERGGPVTESPERSP